MRPVSPYVLAPVDASPGQAVTAVADAATDLVEVTACGRWDRRLWVRTHRVLNRCLAQHPRGLIVDLSALDDPGGRSASSWSAACAMGARMQPPVPMAVCLPAEAPLAARLRRLAGADPLPLVATMPGARAALLGHGPSVDRLRLLFPADPGAPAAARAAVSDACHDWGLESLLHPARLVVGELVHNAVQHARTPIEFIVSRRGADERSAALHLAVCDGEPALPVLRETTPGMVGTALDQPGLGLHIVEAAAFAWGAAPTRDGKMVWALVRQNDGHARPARRPDHDR